VDGDVHEDNMDSRAFYNPKAFELRLSVAAEWINRIDVRQTRPVGYRPLQNDVGKAPT
jgi:hypothetical protein